MKKKMPIEKLPTATILRQPYMCEGLTIADVYIQAVFFTTGKVRITYPKGNGKYGSNDIHISELITSSLNIDFELYK